MLLTLGVISFFQITFIPGYLMLNFFEDKTATRLQKMIYAFGLSLSINFLFVFLLTFLHLYKLEALIIYIALESALLIIRVKKINLQFDPVYSFKKNLGTLLLILSLIAIGHYLYLFILNLDIRSVFLTGDALDSWNKWAVEWSKNIFPTNIAYTQLIPANWSLSYLLMQNNQIQMFAKLIMPLFLVFILLIFLDLSLRYKKSFYLLALLITAYLFHYFFDSSFIRDGYVDIAVTFFAGITFYSLLLFKKEKNQTNLYLASVFAFASFFTKQSGLYIIFLVYFALFVTSKLGQNIREILLAKLLVMIKIKKKVVLPKIDIYNLHINFAFFIFNIFLWILVFVWGIQQKNQVFINFNDYYLTTHAFSKNVPVYFRFITSLSDLIRLTSIKTVIIIPILIFFMSLGFKHQISKFIILFFILPVFIFWCLFLSYDQRNLAIIFPFMGYAAAVGFFSLVEEFKKRNRTLQTELAFKTIKLKSTFKINPFLLFAVFIAFIIFINTFIIKDPYFETQQKEAKKEIGIQALNEKLYSFYYNNGLKGKIFTSYHRLSNLPELQNFYLYQNGSEDLNEQNDFSYLLVSTKIYEVNKNKVGTKKYKVIFSLDGWTFAEVQNSP